MVHGAINLPMLRIVLRLIHFVILLWHVWKYPWEFRKTYHSLTCLFVLFVFVDPELTNWYFPWNEYPYALGFSKLLVCEHIFVCTQMQMRKFVFDHVQKCVCGYAKLFLFSHTFDHRHTLYNLILRIARNLLETREKNKIESHPFYVWLIFMGIKTFFFFFCKKQNPKWPIFQNGHFSKSPILEIFLWKFNRLILGLVGFNDAKGIDVAQPIWSWGCLT